ncbi:AAA family ATPase [Winogradskyella rapida]|uniref:AAA family ATPase n=2 Tax=Winogradskyella rapida TaxID=549701 RepID=A0ABW3KNK8_9FLAO
MRIKSFKITDFKPIKNIEMDNLGDIIIIAGANGAGKTRLKQAIVQTLQGSPIMDMTIEATRKEEVEPKYFNGSIIEVKKGQKNQVLKNYINSRKYGAGKYVGSLVQIDSNRSIQAISYSQVNWLAGDPDDAVGPSNFYFSAFSGRWQNFVNYIHQKSASRDKKLADSLKKEPTKGEEIIEKNPDPFEKYKKIFSDLLPGKELLNINPAQPREFQYKDESGQPLPFNALSSGEQEVVKVLFDVARKEIKHSVIIIDEPELHLHPTLTFKLIESLKSIGEHTNQFIFLTHSADLISTYYSTGNVYFIDSTQTGTNQAHRLSDLNHSHHELVQLIGENLGLFAVGKKLVFVEGESSSIDRLTYHKIALSVNPELKISPVGSVINIGALKTVEEQLRNSVFGVDMYMLRDRDGLRQDQIDELEEGQKLVCLKRRHIENYFLNEEILHKVANHLYLSKNGTNISVEHIKSEMKRIASETVGFNLYKNFKEHIGANYSIKVPKVTSINQKTLEEIKTLISDGLETNLNLLSTELEKAKTLEWLENEKTRLEELLNSDDWKIEFQGKIIFSKLCSEVLKGNALSIRECYVDIAIAEEEDGIKEIAGMFEAM